MAVICRHVSSVNTDQTTKNTGGAGGHCFFDSIKPGLIIPKTPVMLVRILAACVLLLATSFQRGGESVNNLVTIKAPKYLSH